MASKLKYYLFSYLKFTLYTKIIMSYMFFVHVCNMHRHDTYIHALDLQHHRYCNGAKCKNSQI